jgi:ketosteroid isomerase-like protein
MKAEEAINLVKKFLQLMEDRDLAAAEALMSPQAWITFPGNKRFASQREVVAASRDRYQWVKKTFDQAEAIIDEDKQIVYILGTLSGVNRHGVSFSGIRYIDRFVLQEGLIIQQDVWNDLAETGVLQRTI